MSFLKNLFTRRPQVPEWASFFNAGDFEAFIRLLREDLARRGVTYHLDPAEGVVHAQLEEGEPNRLGLGNLAQKCKQTPRPAWEETIRGHLDFILDGRRERDRLIEEFSGDLAQARPYLRVRVVPPIYGEADVVSWPLAESALAVLVYDFPDSTATVQRSHPEKWGRPLDELFRIGIENARAEEAWNVETLALGEGGVSVDCIAGDSFYAATAALFLDELLPVAPELGLLVGIPTRHFVVTYPIRDSEVILAIQQLLPFLYQVHHDGPGSISPELLWRRPDGTFLRLPSRISGKKLEFSPPEEFTNQVILKLAPQS